MRVDINTPRKPEITPLNRHLLNVNDETASDGIAAAFRGYVSADRVKHTGPAPPSQNFGCFGATWQMSLVFWFLGGNNSRNYAETKMAGRLDKLPVNHGPQAARVRP
jgi:hypothetical protein